MNLLASLLLICCFYYSFASNVIAEQNNTDPCGAWESWRDEKCFLAFSGTQTFKQAELACAVKGHYARLLTIHSAAEEVFMESYVISGANSAGDNIWLGARSAAGDSNLVFHWSDGSEMTFTNWAKGYPKNFHSNVDSCVQMNSNDELKGKWTNVPCDRYQKNLFVCERSQPWTLAKVQARLVRLIENPVPLGFIYVQLPREKSPQEIWPSFLSWTDISFLYDSTFFRVVGGKAAAFGTVQEGFSPYIDAIRSADCQSWPADDCAKSYAKFTSSANISSRSGGWTGNIWSAGPYNSGSKSTTVPPATKEYRDALAFHTAGGEVRPRNMAVRVWKRTG